MGMGLNQLIHQRIKKKTTKTPITSSPWPKPFSLPIDPSLSSNDMSNKKSRSAPINMLWRLIRTPTTTLIESLATATKKMWWWQMCFSDFKDLANSIKVTESFDYDTPRSPPKTATSVLATVTNYKHGFKYDPDIYRHSQYSIGFWGIWYDIDLIIYVDIRSWYWWYGR